MGGRAAKAFLGWRLLVLTAGTTNDVPSVFLNPSATYSLFSFIRTFARRRRKRDLLTGLDVGHPGPLGPSKHTHTLRVYSMGAHTHACVLSAGLSHLTGVSW